MALSLNFILLGAFFRRWWGGWFAPRHWVKLPCGFLLGGIVGLAGTGSIVAALLTSVALGFAFLNPSHAYGQRMGYGGPPSFGEAFGAMAQSYGSYLMAGAGVWAWALGNAWMFIAPLFVLLVPIAYWFAQVAWRWFGLRELVGSGTNFMLDSPTAYGEMVLGAVLVGALPLTAAVVGA